MARCRRCAFSSYSAVTHTLVRWVLRLTIVFLVAYVLCFFASMLLIVCGNYKVAAWVTAVAAKLMNVGPGLELVGPAESFSLFSATAKLVRIFDMLAGRLELFPMLLLFAPSIWRRRSFGRG